MTDKIGPKERQVRDLREQRAAAKKIKRPSTTTLKAKIINIKKFKSNKGRRSR